MVEHRTFNAVVAGSIPARLTKIDLIESAAHCEFAERIGTPHSNFGALGGARWSAMCVTPGTGFGEAREAQ